MKVFNKIIRTDRLILRPFSMDDVSASYEMEQNPAVNKYTGDGGVKSLEVMGQLISNVINVDYANYGFGRMAIVSIEDNCFIGFAGLKYLADIDEVDLGYRLRQEYWGRGLATEASAACVKFGFEELGLDKIVAFVEPENVGSSRVLDKLGFQFEAKFDYDGDMVDKYVLRR